jgi:hypothetical protein
MTVLPQRSTKDAMQVVRESLVLALHARLGSAADIAEIEAEVEAEIASYSSARITAFVPILVERHVEARLRARRCSA